DGLLNDARLGRRLGFQGKLVIHPRQVEIVNSAYSPAPEEVENARRVIAAFEEAEKQGLAAIQLEGKMIDYPVAVKARQIIARAEAIAEKQVKP
ncbi:MAG: HpcH/HpaI aldolase/citrate lyase family protein, partial [Moorella sp. (in: Bacteria)]|nr:HpcH/HpaI aldolase/citrate lyase family protein [Moorella sp. (in: firmicutes)]